MGFLLLHASCMQNKLQKESHVAICVVEFFKCIHEAHCPFESEILYIELRKDTLFFSISLDHNLQNRILDFKKKEIAMNQQTQDKKKLKKEQSQLDNKDLQKKNAYRTEKGGMPDKGREFNTTENQMKKNAEDDMGMNSFEQEMDEEDRH